MIVIFGSTGNSGGAAARALLEDKLAVRVVGRDRAKLQPFVDLGAEAAVADLEHPTQVAAALEGATAAYLLIPPNITVEDFRGYQQRVSGNLSRAIPSSGCRKVVLLSSLGANHGSGTGPIVGLHEFEQLLKAIPNLDVLAIRAGYFMENFYANVAMVKSMGILGAPAPAEAPMSLIAAADIGTYAAKRLARVDFSGFEVVNLIGPSLVTFGAATKAIGTAIGKPDLPYVQFSYADAKAGMIAAGIPAPMAELYIEMYQGAAAGLLQPEPGTPVAHTETPFTAFAERFASALRAAS